MEILITSRKCCVPGCETESGSLTLHLFPKPTETQRFNTWVMSIGGNLLSMDNAEIYRFGRVCHAHFEKKYCCRDNRIINIALPTLKLPAKEPYEAREMGAKTPDQVNKARPAVKCDVCGRKFLNVQALKSHHKFLHMKDEAPKRPPLKRQIDTKPNIIRKKMVPLNMLKRVNATPEIPATQAIKTVAVKSPDLAGKLASVPKKPEFECPICAEKFPVYFTAFRHIQKNHCVDDNGEKVAPNSPLLVKPIRIEFCATCKSQIRSSELHTCPKVQSNKDHYLCLGCQQVFGGLVLFQQHVKGLHADGVKNYFFPSENEFTCWKADLEEGTGVEFTRLNKQRNKDVYHCSHQSGTVTTNTKLCPSSITIRYYPKGVGVCYYKEHHGHTVDNLPLKKYNNYCISKFTRETEELRPVVEDDTDDLYSEFKKIVTCVVFDAAKVDVSTLTELLGKALEMTTVLKHYKEEDQSASLISKSLTDAQISKNLDSLKPDMDSLKPDKESLKPDRDSLKPVQGKRKLSIAKETKKDEPKKVKKSESVEKLVENGVKTKSQKKATQKEEDEVDEHFIISSPALNKSVSFNSKKIEKTIQKNIQKKKEETPLKSSLRKKDEIPPKTLTKKVEEPKETVPEIPLAPTPVPRSMIQSPSSFNDSYKNFVDQNFKTQQETSTPKRVNVKKKVVKTKIGQFKVKPSLSPKDLSPKIAVSPKVLTPKVSVKVSPKVSPKEVKQVKVVKEIREEPFIPKSWKIPDIEYEVEEQENDCNILILKI